MRVLLVLKIEKKERAMPGSLRPRFVIFGSSIVQFGFYDEGWVAILSHLYARKVHFFFFFSFCEQVKNLILLTS